MSARTSAVLSAALSAVISAVSLSQVQTGDPAKRGLAPTDFPRTKQLAPGVYSYEALRAGDPGMPLEEFRRTRPYPRQ
jgi:hypothetical protein